MQEPRPLPPMRPVRADDVLPDRGPSASRVVMSCFPYVLAVISLSLTTEWWGFGWGLVVSMAVVAAGSVALALVMRARRRPRRAKRVSQR